MNLKYIISAILGALVASSYFLILEKTQIRSETADFSNGKDDIVEKPLVHLKEPAVLLSESDLLEELEVLRSQNTKLLSTIEKLEQKIQVYAALDKELSSARASVDKLHSIKQVTDAKSLNENGWIKK